MLRRRFPSGRIEPSRWGLKKGAGRSAKCYKSSVHRLFFVLLLVGCPGPGPDPGPDPTPPASVTETALPPCVSPQAPGFDDGLTATGLDFVSETLPNDEVSGVVVADFDADGLGDVILGQLDGPLSIF